MPLGDVVRLLGLREGFHNGLVKCIPLFAIGVEGSCDYNRGHWANNVKVNTVILQRQLPALHLGGALGSKRAVFD